MKPRPKKRGPLIAARKRYRRERRRELYVLGKSAWALDVWWEMEKAIQRIEGVVALSCTDRNRQRAAACPPKASPK